MKTLHPKVILRSIEQRARKRFGQHFLTDMSVVEKMVRRAGVKPGERVLEIGPGLGVLTRALLEAGAKVTCVELDRDLADYIEEMIPQVTLIRGDALRQNWAQIVGESPMTVVANLPYNVGTPLVIQMLEHRELFKSINVMLQKEVVDRMLAGPGSKTYGALSVQVQAVCEPSFLVSVPPESFHPAPKVQSSVIRLNPLEHPRAGRAGVKRLNRVVRASFSQRRKVLPNSLGSLVGKETVKEALESMELDPKIRAEQLSLAQYCQLTDWLFDRQVLNG
jgi:16S rRNA (adenine1518-N6/adenine1519-N6)-dimethyltransferase